MQISLQSLVGAGVISQSLCNGDHNWQGSTTGTVCIMLSLDSLSSWGGGYNEPHTPPTKRGCSTLRFNPRWNWQLYRLSMLFPPCPWTICIYEQLPLKHDHCNSMTDSCGWQSCSVPVVTQKSHGTPPMSHDTPPMSHDSPPMSQHLFPEHPSTA